MPTLGVVVNISRRSAIAVFIMGATPKIVVSDVCYAILGGAGFVDLYLDQCSSHFELLHIPYPIKEK